jgi:hypothetical protein
MVHGLDSNFFPLFSIASNDFERDLEIVKRVFLDFGRLIHTEGGFRLSERAEMAAGWWFYDVLVSQEYASGLFRQLIPATIRDRKSASIKMIDTFQDQLRKRGSEARIKMHGQVPFAGPWWARLMK